MAKYMKYLGKILLLGAILLICVVLVSAVVDPKDCTEEAGLQDYGAYAIAAEPENSLDVIFIGDSSSAASLAPLKMYEEQGFTSYQTSSKGQRLCLTTFMIRHALEKQQPKMVVIEADTIYYEVSAFRELGYVGMHYFPVVLYHDRWKSLSLRDFNPIVDYHTPDPNKGFLAKENWDPAEFPVDFMMRNASPAPFGKLESALLEDVVSYIQSKGIKVVFAATPNPQTWTLGRHNAVAEYCAAKGFDFIDMNDPAVMEQLGIDWSVDTQDAGAHMNARGAMKVSKWMGDYLAATYDLPDHRADARFADWGVAAKDFLQRMDAIEYTPFDWSQETGVMLL